MQFCFILNFSLNNYAIMTITDLYFFRKWNRGDRSPFWLSCLGPLMYFLPMTSTLVAFSIYWLGPSGRDRMVVGFITTYVISNYKHQLCVLDTTLSDKVCQWLATGRWFSPSTPVSSSNKTDATIFTEILLKTLNTINQPQQLH